MCPTPVGAPQRGICHRQGWEVQHVNVNVNAIMNVNVNVNVVVRVNVNLILSTQPRAVNVSANLNFSKQPRYVNVNANLNMTTRHCAFGVSIFTLVEGVHEYNQYVKSFHQLTPAPTMTTI